MDISQECLRLAKLALKPYATDEGETEQAAQWMAKRIQTGIKDDLEDLVKQGHITEVPY